MGNYYLEQLRNAERKLNFAKVGYMNEVREIAKDLSTCSYEEVEAHSKRLSEAMSSIKEMESACEYYMDQYSEKVGEEAKKV